jgi:hypothetical protein
MTDIHIVLTCIRKSFSFLWDDFEFHLTQLKPRDGYRNSGYEIRLENEYSELVFLSEMGVLDEAYIRTKGLPHFGRGLKRLTKLLTGEEAKSFFTTKVTDEEYFDSIAGYIRPVLPQVLELVKTPALFKETIEALESSRKSNPITVEMIRSERARLHSLGLDSSLGAAVENLRKRGKNE